ncbi:response regulator [Chitinispirillales bacterium ANBcel5]|uniref:response regulator n=1 Tax=Cellulosispirillum alkaliphilum TaxID=3039283 RepID=UPI002A54FEE8|nr:response regulator [Chitinispirillales bacterium ANBcel5]
MGRILIVDDEEAILLAFQKLLQKQGVTVDVANSTVEAYAFIETKDYDVLIIDLRIEGTAKMQGCELVTMARTLHPLAIIIVITAYGDEDLKSHALQAGADMFLIKPVSPIALRTLLQKKGIYASSDTSI